MSQQLRLSPSKSVRLIKEIVQFIVLLADSSGSKKAVRASKSRDSSGELNPVPPH